MKQSNAHLVEIVRSTVLRLKQRQTEQHGTVCDAGKSSSCEKSKTAGTASELTNIQATDLQISTICRLWAGMGYIYKIEYRKPFMSHKRSTEVAGNAASLPSVFVVKQVTPPDLRRQSFGDQRKAKSYQVEASFYQHIALQLLPILRLPEPYLVQRGPQDGEVTIVMSYVQGAGLDCYNVSHIRAVLRWFARFHASYWGKATVDALVQNVGLQEVGTYWHLDTRPDEHESMSNKGWEGRLKHAARAIDECLKRDPMQCLVHGDAKDANVLICTSIENGVLPSSSEKGAKKETFTEAVLYDFQYCGSGSPTKDLAYFLCSSTASADEEASYLEYYHTQLLDELSCRSPNARKPSLEHLKASMELAYMDYCRFMCGWGHWGIDVRERVKKCLDSVDGGKDLKLEQAYDQAIRTKFW